MMTCIKKPFGAGLDRSRSVLEKLAQDEIRQRSQEQNKVDLAKFRLKGMSHPRLDFIAFEPRSKSKIKRVLAEDGKSDLYFHSRHNEVLEK